MSKGEWTFLTNHGRVLIYVAKHPLTTAREMAQMAGITERTVQKIVADLVRGGYLVAHRRGRCNQYVVHPERPMRHGMEQPFAVGDMMKALGCELKKEDAGPGRRKETG
jgi:DNA-binding transcriptional regulator YhcF (GntR family)